MSKNQGFGVVGVILIAVTLVLIGLIAWKLMMPPSSDKTPSQVKSTKKYEDGSKTYSFEYPSDWTPTPTGTDNVELKVPGTVTTELPIGSYQINKGAIVGVYSSSCNDACSLEDTYEGIYKNVDRGTVTLKDGTVAARFTFGYESEPATHTVFYKNGLRYSITFTSEGEEASSPFFPAYTDLVNSFKFIN